jgi:4-hydroxy-4-methyl-2-oxoglutarate aldolase
MKPVVVTETPRAPSDVVGQLGAFGTATVHEAMGRTGLLGDELRPVWSGAKAAGTAVTALCLPGDNLTIHLAVEQIAKGDVLVVSTTSPSRDGFIGELFTTALAARGAVGLVTTTGIRDVADITAAGFACWSRTISAQGTVKASAGEVNRPLAIAGTVVRPGDVIVADDDGVVCVPRESAAETVAACRAREEREAQSRERYRQGEISLDVNNLRGLVEDLGVSYVTWESEREQVARGR